MACEMEDSITNAMSGEALQSHPIPPTSTPTERVSSASTLRDEESNEKHKDAPVELFQAKNPSPAGVARVTREYSLTAKELRNLRHPGDTITIEARYEVKLIEDNEGRRLFLSQPLLSTEPNSHRETSVPLPRPSPRRRSKQGSILASIDPKNILDKTEDGEERSSLDTPPISSIPSSSYSLRNRRATQGKLVYDVKYHPMDDSIRPSQAAKRRSAHGEVILLSDDTIGNYSVHDDSDDEEQKDEVKTENIEPNKRGKKRVRRRSLSHEPTRRSSRKTATPRISYNMNIHPQDRDLEMSSTDDSASERSDDEAKRTKLSRSNKEKPVSELQCHTKALSTVTISSEATIPDEEEPSCHNGGSCPGNEDASLVEEQVTITKSTSPLPFITAPPPYGIRRKEGLDVWLLNPGERYFRHDRDSWPSTPGLYFDIHTERLEDQLAAEAKAASPLNFEEDDKENDVVDNELEEELSFTDGISVVPASQYRPVPTNGDTPTHLSPATEAFYHEHILSSYGIGGSDGSHDQNDHDIGPNPAPATLSIRCTCDQASCAPNIQGPTGKLNSMPSSESLVTVDSVCG